MKRKSKRKSNPIIVAAKRGLRGGHQFLAILGKWDELPPKTQRDILRGFFTDETIDEIGSLLLGALMIGDKQMAVTYKDAFRQFNHIFNRDRELTLLEPALRYRLTNW